MRDRKKERSVAGRPERDRLTETQTYDRRSQTTPNGVGGWGGGARKKAFNLFQGLRASTELLFRPRLIFFLFFFKKKHTKQSANFIAVIDTHVSDVEVAQNIQSHHNDEH